MTIESNAVGDQLPDGDSKSTEAPGDASSRAKVIARLFREHNEELISFLRTRSRADHEAREIAQEAYVRMLELESPGAVGFLRAYLFKVAANVAIDRSRRKAALSRIHEQWIDPFDSLERAPSADQVVNARHELELVRQFLSELPARCRQAFYLERFRDLSVTQIAEQLHVSERTVRNYLVQALVYCRQRLDEARGMHDHAPVAGAQEKLP